MRKKRTTITVETERLITMSRPQCLYALCQQCGEEVRLVTVNEAAAIAQVNALSVYRLVDAGTLHYSETTAGAVLVCAASLRDLISNQKG